ncbi:MAG: ParB/RepB/Spo0J family partition protein [Polyangiaceae bacterium]|nr:ParB/RepB/Spo0J family partition protein [Polyangiaceae bacterium]
MEHKPGEPPRKLRGLGRGLDALLPAPTPPAPRGGGTYGEGNVFTCALDKIVPQKGQPRQHFDGKALDELAQSIREHGLLEPLVVRRIGQTDRFELVAGERRWRACQRAGLREALVVVRDVSTRDAFELALIENIQREDLDPIDFAEALQRLLEEHDYTQESLAQRVGKERSTIANALRLLRLPEVVRVKIRHGELSEGHARALLGAPNETALLALAEKVARGHLSVRQTEALVRAAKQAAGKRGGGPPPKTAGTRDLEQRLAQKLGTRCEVRDRGGAGELVIRYASLDELDRILDQIL